MDKRHVITFPHMGDYSVPIANVLQTLFPLHAVAPAPAMTAETLEIGSRHSPDMICAPFKYNIGNFVQALEAGATVIIQTGMGCRYGYYGELQEQILKDLGYDFTFACFSRDRARLPVIYRMCRELGCALGPLRFARALVHAALSIAVMDGFAFRMREGMAAERIKGSQETLYGMLLNELKSNRTLGSLPLLAYRYKRAQKRLAKKGEEPKLKIGIVGELYTLMEPFSNFYIEKKLSEYGALVSRRMSITFLLTKREKRVLKKTRHYVSYSIGANGADSVAQSIAYAHRGYDGIIHMKSFGCAPEVNAMPVLQNISKRYGIPILHLSFDAHTSEVGVLTRLEAFVDMLNMRREKDDECIPGRGYRLDFDQGGRHR